MLTKEKEEKLVVAGNVRWLSLGRQLWRFFHMTRQLHPWFVPNGVKTCVHKKTLHMGAYSIFTPNYPNLEAVKNGF